MLVCRRQTYRLMVLIAKNGFNLTNKHTVSSTHKCAHPKVLRSRLAILKLVLLAWFTSRSAPHLMLEKFYACRHQFICILNPFKHYGSQYI